MTDYLRGCVIIRLIDADALLKEYDGAEYEINSSAYAKGCNDVVKWSRKTINEQPTIDAVPVNELLKLRDWLYESDVITMGGLRSLNELIAKYSNDQLPRIENGFERRNT